jgi:RNA-binding protein
MPIANRNRPGTNDFTVIPCAFSAAATATTRGEMDLSSAQIKKLRAEGHRLKLKPIVTIGQKGLGDNLHNEIEIALNHHELLKLRIPGDDKPAKREMAKLLCERHQAILVEAIGNVIVIYRCNPEIDRFTGLLG